MHTLTEIEARLTQVPPPPKCSVGLWVEEQSDSLRAAIAQAEVMSSKVKPTTEIYDTLKDIEGFPVKYNQYRFHRNQKCTCYES